MTTLHHKSKRYEVQTYSETTLAWEPVAHTDNPTVALEKVQNLNVNGKKVRIRDRVADAVVLTANQLCPKPTKTKKAK